MRGFHYGCSLKQDAGIAMTVDIIACPFIADVENPRADE
jgi:hypothetical protein